MNVVRVPFAPHALRGYLDVYGRRSCIVGSAITAGVLDPSLGSMTVIDFRSDTTITVPGAQTEQTLVGISSSGSTSAGRICVFEANVQQAMAEAISHRLGLGPDREAVAFVPPGFAYGLSIINSHIVARAIVTFATAPVTLCELPELIRATAADLVYAVPSQLAGFRSVTWRDQREITIVVAGAPMPTSVAAAIGRALPSAHLVNMYGQVELGPRVATRCTPVDEFEEGNVGLPLEGVRVGISSEGEIVVTSPFAMARYLTDPVSGSEPARPRHTRDIGTLATTGELHINGRIDNRFNVAGVLVSTEDIEAAVLSQPEVSACRVQPVPGLRGQRPRIEIVLAQGAPASEVRARVLRAVRTRVCREASHALIDIVEEIALTQAGKVSRR